MTRLATGWNVWRMGLLALVHCTSAGAGAQGFLTVGEVYDYDAGDVIHHRYSQAVNGQSGPPVTRIDTISDEYWTADLDSVRYVLSRWLYQPSMFGGAPSLNHWTDTLWYTDLSSAPEHFSLPIDCQILGDTLGEDVIPFDEWSPDCAGDEWYRRVVGDTCSGWDEATWGSWFVAGCGGPYSTSYEPFTFTLQTHSLVYCRKGMVECGTPLTIPLGLGDKEISPRVAIATSLFTDVVEFSVAEGGGCEVVCFDGRGRTVVRDRLRVGKAFLNTSTWAVGPYSFVCSMDDGTAFLRGVKVQ